MAYRVVAIVIGQNEAHNLAACLGSVMAAEDVFLLYVDSGSHDESAAIALDLGVDTLLLDASRPYTAARARAAGMAWLQEQDIAAPYVQFIDGDCIISPYWLRRATQYLDTHAHVAAVAGVLAEREADTNIYHRAAAAEWAEPVGEAAALGGIMMMRRRAYDAVGGFDPTLRAGEEPELCLRLRRAGWQLMRISAPMAVHDIAMCGFASWWRRAERAGLAAAQGVSKHGFARDFYAGRALLRAVFWAGLAPFSIALGLFWPPGFLLLLLYVIQGMRIARAWQRPYLTGAEAALLFSAARFAECRGAIVALARSGRARD